MGPMARHVGSSYTRREDNIGVETNCMDSNKILLNEKYQLAMYTEDIRVHTYKAQLMFSRIRI